MVRFFVRFWVRKGRLIWSKIYRSIFERKYAGKLLPTLATEGETLTPDKVLIRLKWVLSKITWRQDKWYMLFDVISYPQTVWFKKEDDCDGFAILAAALLEQARNSVPRLGNVFLLTVVGRPLENSHTVCVFDIDGVLYVADNNYVYRSSRTTIDKIAEDYLKKNFKKPYCWQLIDVNLKEIKYVEATNEKESPNS